MNRRLSALSAFYQHAARHGVDLADPLVSWQRGGGRSGSFKAFLHHVSKSAPVPGWAIKLKVPRKHPQVVTAAEAQKILDACTGLRDRLLFAVLHDAGIGIGETVGMRHEDIATAEREIVIRPRINDNGARTKSSFDVCEARPTGFSFYSPPGSPTDPLTCHRTKIPLRHCYDKRASHHLRSTIAGGSPKSLNGWRWSPHGCIGARCLMPRSSRGV